jgi:hypothetical protein
LRDGEEPHPSNYRGCRHAKEELQKRKAQRALNPATGRVFSKYTTPSVSFAAVLGTKMQQQQIPKPVPQACPARTTMPTEQHQE